MSGLIQNLKNIVKIIVGLHYKVFAGLFLAAAVISILALRSNNQEMVRLREAVYQADRQGGDVNAALNQLRAYVYGHMNTDLSSGGNTIKPPIQLKYSYERLVQAEQDRVDAVNERLYPEAQAYCERQNPVSVSGRTRIACTENYVLTNGAKPNTIPPGLYQFDFVSPLWSPDRAGWSLVLSVLLFIAFALRLAADKLSKEKPKS